MKTRVLHLTAGLRRKLKANGTYGVNSSYGFYDGGGFLAEFSNSLYWLETDSERQERIRPHRYQDLRALDSICSNR